MKDNNVFKPLYLKVYHTLIAMCRGLFHAGFEKTTLLVYKLGRSANSIFWIGQIRYKRKPAIYNITALKTHLEQHGKGQSYNIICEAEEIEVFGPQFYPETQKTAMVSRPEIFYSELESITIVGGCNVIVCDAGTLIFEEFEKGEFSRIDFESALTPFVSKNRMILDSTDTSQVIQKGISLCGLGCENLYHWLFEFIARLKIIEFADPKYTTWPILVDERLRNIPQLLEILELYAPDREYIFIKYGHKVKVKNLLHLSLLIWTPFNFQKGEVCTVKDCIISPLAVEFIRSKIAPQCTIHPGKRIFISRKNFPERRQINEQEILKVLQPLGFEVICAENLTFAEQMSVFQDAEVVIGVTGAALSNIVFCKPGTTIICLISAKVELGIFSNIAKLLDLNLVYLAGDGDVSFGHVHKPFKVDTNLLTEVLQLSIDTRGT